MVLTLLHHPGQRHYTITLTPGDTMYCEVLHTNQAVTGQAAGQGTLRAGAPGHSPTPPVPLDALLALFQHKAGHLQKVEECDADDVGDGVVDGEQAPPEPAGRDR